MRIEGYAVISEDGMIADASGLLPPSLIAETDQQFFQDGLSGVDVVVHGRNSEETHPKSLHRRRIILTRDVKTVAPDPERATAILWNPAGASFETALAAFETPPRSAAILGGTHVFGLFLDRYTIFFLSRIAGARLPGGRPVFPQVPGETPESVLSTHGLRSKGCERADPAAGLIISRWERPV